jgi:serine/threonine protein kinase
MPTPAPLPAVHRPRGEASSAAAPVSYVKSPGQEPLPGYRLIAPLGRGGFGEVWKAEAPGGLYKAIKFVVPDSDARAFQQEFEAFQHIKAIRHPFILQLERVELIAGELVMVMELADGQLQDRFDACVAAGLPGIPRQELLSYFADAAEALDVIGTKYGLQHLDIKPANIFLVSGHAKVGDYGLVARLETGTAAESATAQRGLTPRYVAPEVLRGRIDPRSDQYSLALVYQELLTGLFAYPGKTAAQLMFQHVMGVPDLSGLPESDREPVGRALQKNPADRFPSCMAFVHALMTANPTGLSIQSRPGTDTAPDLLLRTRVSRSVANLHLSPTQRAPKTERVPPADVPDSPAAPSAPPVAAAGKFLPPLTLAGPKRPLPPPPPPPSFEEILLVPAPSEATAAIVQLKPIYPVVPVSRLLGASDERAGIHAEAFTETVVAALAGGTAPRTVGEVTLLPDGTWVSRFPTTLLPTVAPLKLTTLVEDGWCDELTQTEPTRIVLRVRDPNSGGGIWSKLAGKPRAGAEIDIRLPNGSRPVAVGRLSGSFTSHTRQSAFAVAAGHEAVLGGAGEVQVAGYVFGTPDRAFALRAMDGIPDLMREVRKLLQNVEDRRKSPRLPTTCTVTVYPITEDGRVYPAVAGVGRDVSTGGVCFLTQSPITTRYVFVQFPEIPVVSELAILTKLLRNSAVGYEHVVAGRFRTDL